MTEDESRFQDLIRPDLKTYGGASNLAFNEEVKKLIQNGRDIAHFGFGLSPFQVPDCLSQSLAQFTKKNEYLAVAGIPELREELSSFHQRYDGLNLSADGFIVGPGSKELIFLTMTVFNGDIIIPSPAWTTYAPQCQLAGRKLIQVETQISIGWKVTRLTLEAALKGQGKRNRILILTNPGNPTGTCYSEEELKNLSDCCREHSIIVLSDEIYARLTFSGVHHSMATYYPEGTILTSGFSKWASAGGWRVGYAHFPPTLSSIYTAVKSGASHTYSCAPAPMQFAIAKCMKNNREELDIYMQNCRRVLKAVGNYCYRELLSVGVFGQMGEAGYYYMPDFEIIRAGLEKRNIFDGQGMVDAMLRDANIALMSSESFLRPKTELTTRFCFICFDGGNITNLSAGKLIDETTLNDQFIETHCKTLASGIGRLKKWVLEHTL